METKQNTLSSNSEEHFRNQIFTHPFEQRFLNWYRSFFSIEEIENSTILHWVFGALLLTYFVTFWTWAQSGAITIDSYLSNTYQCWPYFQSCGEYYFLSNLPYGYTQPLLYVFFFGVMTLIVYLMGKREWVLAHSLLGILFLWKFIVITFLTAGLSGNYDYFDIAFTFILLVLPHKLFFLKLMFVMFYFLAATVKIDSGWILGTYFTALKTGMPLFPDPLAPLMTNLVIFMQIVGAWFLLSTNKILQRGAVIYFLCFHLYSGVLVYYRYLTTAIPMLLILFGPLYTETRIPYSKKSIAGWVFVSVLMIWQFIPFMIPGDHKMTLEGNRFGLYMFEANHQCVSRTTILLKDGTSYQDQKESVSARNRCDPYKYWFQINEICNRYSNIAQITWSFDHSINGGPFYRIVDVSDACALEYKPFRHNKWIKLPEDSPEIIGFPFKNYYY